VDTDQHARRHSVGVGGVRTSWLEAGEGAPDGPPPLVLLHGGAWGESAGTAWAGWIPKLPGRRVLAPDWLGFGESDKLRDFIDLQGRMVAVLAGWLDAVGVTRCDAVGLSMGGANVLRDQGAAPPLLPLRRLVLISAGGAPLTARARARLGDYDGSLESMRAQVALACADPAVAADDVHVAERHRTSLLPGAFEVMASLSLRSPVASPPPPGDPTPYERIGLPVLVVTGDRDELKPPGFADGVLARLPDARHLHVPQAGHCVQLDAPDVLATAVLAFLDADTPSAHDDKEHPTVTGHRS